MPAGEMTNTQNISAFLSLTNIPVGWGLGEVCSQLESLWNQLEFQETLIVGEAEKPQTSRNSEEKYTKAF